MVFGLSGDALTECCHELSTKASIALVLIQIKSMARYLGSSDVNFILLVPSSVSRHSRKPIFRIIT